MKRRQFLAVSALAAVPLAGCLASAEETIPLGESYSHGDVSIEVSRLDVADVLTVDGPNGPAELSRQGSVFVTPWVRIENDSDSSFDLPNPLTNVDVLYAGERAHYAGGRFDEITVDGDTYRTYRAAYREHGGAASPGDVVEGLGAVFRLPAEFDTGETAVRVTVGNRDYLWGFDDQE